MVAGMNKPIRILTASAAALAASLALAASVPAAAQQGQYRNNDLAGGPGSQPTPQLFPNQDRDYDRDYHGDDRGDYRYGDNDRRRAPDFQNAQRACSRAGIQEAWNRNFYSAQYDGGPRLEYGRRGWELRGRMRLHNNRGYSYVNTVCDLGRGGSADHFEFLR